MPVYHYGVIIPEKVCDAFKGDERALFDALGREDPRAIRCLTRRLIPSITAESERFSLEPDEISDIVTDTVVKTIIQIKRGKT
jgi:hypothetical protein